ncbi:hypothetical protein MMC19_007702 [Ptychographa xylographoides]|nr:hypothetical protein [Ptychographa xylographoides]
MPSATEPLRTWRVLLFVVLCSLLPVASVTTKVLPTQQVLQNTNTCPFRTINYITQTLPQQCFRTSWSSGAIHYGDAIPGSVRTIHNSIVEHSLVTSDESYITRAHPDLTEALKPIEDSRSVQPAAAYASSSNVLAQTATQIVPDRSAPSAEDAEADPLSDNANFLSFEQWRAQMLEKAGQSPETLGSVRVGTEHRHRPDAINNALDSLGEEGEIELDFSGFVKSDNAQDALPLQGSETTTFEKEKVVSEERDQGSKKKSKDAGTTCKERFNYASFDCAATVLKTNPECKGSTSVLVENKDSYMLNLCSAKNKFFVVELCNDILIDTVVLGNFEFFSSTFRTFRVSVSDRYPVKIDKWKDLGTFEARNSRDVQAFLVENPLIWARYLRIEFLTHYGNEYYCPVSLLRVHGKTMMDDYRNEVKATRGDEELDDEISEGEDDISNGQPLEVIAAQVTRSGFELAKTQTVEALNSSESTAEPTAAPIASTTTTIPAFDINSTETSGFIDRSSQITYYGPLLEQYQLKIMNCTSTKTFCHMKSIDEILTVGRPELQLPQKRVSGIRANASLYSPLLSTTSSPSNVIETGNTTSITTLPPTVTETATKENLVTPHTVPTTRHVDSENAVISPSLTSSPKAHSNHTAHTTSKVTQPPATPSPSTQESFFKSIHKRLQLLEANSTLSLQYIEEQSRILREAFTKVEKRQLAKTNTFLESLNTTVLSELREFRLQYDQIWQSTVLELSSQREQSQREVLVLSARLGVLADEILFQKRMVILQFVLILLCLGLAIFSPRIASSSAAYLELPTAVQNMVSRPSTSFSRYLHHDSPPGTPSRPSSRYGFFSRTVNHMRSPSNVSGDDITMSKPTEAPYAPPTPVSNSSDGELTPSQHQETSEGVDASGVLRRAASSPAIGNERKDTVEDA